jgi:hypothetical protein
MLMDTRLGDLVRALDLITDDKVWLAAVNQSVLDEIARLITEDQLASGIDGQGRQLGEYAPLSVIIRQELGLQTKFIDLHLTGEFYESITATVTRYGITIDGEGQKPDQNLFTTFGDDIINLTDENTAFVVEEIRDNVIAYILEAMGFYS